MTDRWIQRAIKHPGSLEEFFKRKVGLPKKARIPTRWLKKIVKAKAGDTVKIRYKGKTHKIKVTRTLERRAILALTLKKLLKRKLRKMAKRKKKKKRR